MDSFGDLYTLAFKNLSSLFLAIVLGMFATTLLSLIHIYKIDKLDKELEKAREKAAEWQAKIRELSPAAARCSVHKPGL